MECRSSSLVAKHDGDSQSDGRKILGDFVCAYSLPADPVRLFSESDALEIFRKCRTLRGSVSERVALILQHILEIADRGISSDQYSNSSTPGTRWRNIRFAGDACPFRVCRNG